MEQSVLSQYARYLHGIEYIAMLDEGIERIKEVASWPDGKLPDETQKIFPAFCEYVAFNMGVKYPFFEALYFFLNNNEVLLFKHICDKDFKGFQLNHDEVFELFRYLGQNKVRDILDLYNKLPSNIYNTILSSLEKEDFSFFSDTLRTDDYSDFSSKLGLLRYILIGQEKGRITDKFHKRHSLRQYSKWFKGCDWESYFVYQNPNCIKKSIKEIISRRILGIDHGIKRSQSIIHKLEYRRTNTLLIKEWIKNIDQNQTFKLYYDGWINKWKSELHNKELFSQKIDNLLLSTDYIVSKCKLMGENIMFMPFYSHPQAVKDYLTRCFEHSNLERWEDIDDNFDEESFGDYMLLMSYKIVEVYNYVSEYLDNEEMKLLKWIINRPINNDKIKYFEVMTDGDKSSVVDEQIQEPQQNNDEDNEINSDHPTQKRDFEVMTDGDKSSVVDEQIQKPQQDNDEDNEINLDYPPQLWSSRRLKLSILQDLVGKKYLPQFFKGGIDNLLYIKYVFFGMGKKPHDKLIFNPKVNKAYLFCFIKYLCGEPFKSSHWSYFEKFIDDERNKALFPANPSSNITKKYEDYKKNFKNTIKTYFGGRELTKEEEEDIR